MRRLENKIKINKKYSDLHILDVENEFVRKKKKN